MDGVSSSKVTGAAHQGGAEAAQDTKNKSTKGDVEGLSNATPQTPPADPASVQGETKKMAELSIKEQEVEQAASSVDDKSTQADAKEVPLSAGEQSPPKSEDGEKTQEAAASTGQPGKTDVDEKAAQDVQASADVSEVPGEASVTDSESAKEENVPNHVGADGGASARTQEGGDSAKNEV